MPVSMLTACQLTPVSSAARSFSRSLVLNAGRPRCLPFARARSRPALVRWLIFFPLKLGERRENREKDIANQLVIRRQMWLAVAVEADAIGIKTLQVDHGRSHTIARKP